MTDIPQNQSDKTPENLSPLPTADEIEARFGPEAKKQWEGLTNDVRKRAMLRQFEKAATIPEEDVVAARTEAVEDAMRLLIDEHETFIRTNGAEAALKGHRERYEADVANFSDPLQIATRVLQMHVIDQLLRDSGYIDFSDVRDTVLADPRCAPIAPSIQRMYLECVKIFIERGMMKRATFDDDE